METSKDWNSRISEAIHFFERDLLPIERSRHHAPARRAEINGQIDFFRSHRFLLIQTTEHMEYTEMKQEILAGCLAASVYSVCSVVN